MPTTVKQSKHPNNMHRYLRGKPIAQAARELSIPERTFRSWVLGEVRIPQRYMNTLTKYFDCTSEQLLIRPVVPLGNIPYQRNSFFTGREELLSHLHHSLNKDSLVVATQPQALCGLGGIGKTQTVIEYAYRYCNNYERVLWIKADTQENIASDILHIAALLQLPEMSRNPAGTIQAVKKWLQEHQDWLLIFDNADDLSLVTEVLPPNHQGHVLITTRAQAMGRFAHRLEVESMDEETGVLFVLRRVGHLLFDDVLDSASEEEKLAAKELVRELGGLPLALDQAGAYIEECQCSIRDYLYFYRQRRMALLAERGGIVNDHPEPVTTTWSLSFQEVERVQPAAADLLRVCAFLAPDAIPEELVVEGALELGPVLASLATEPLLLHQAISALRRYSLIRRTPIKNMLNLHRLVQVVQKAAMSAEVQHKWAERVIRAVNSVFPSKVDVESWPQCERLLSQAQMCIFLIEEEHFSFPEASHLLNQTAYYLRERARYAEAEQLYRKALDIRERVLGLIHLEVAQSCYNLARLYFDLGRYADAEVLYRRALDIRRQCLDAKHVTIAQTLNSIALTLWCWRDRLEEAEQLYEEALTIFDQTVSYEHPLTAHCLNNLALLQLTLMKYEEAERLNLQVLDIRERLLPLEHLDTAQSLQNLACVYIEQGVPEMYPRAQALLERSLHIREQLLGPEHPQTARSLNNLAALYEAQGRHTEARVLYERAVPILEKSLGAENQKTQATRFAYEALLSRMEISSL